MRNGNYELVVAPEGYPGKRYRGRYCYKHHLVWWKNTGALPASGQVIHHKNGDPLDNKFRNLELKEFRQHVSEHQEPAKVERQTCGSCGEQFERPSRYFRCKRNQGQTTFYCSRKCGGRARTGRKRAWTTVGCPVCEELFEIQNSVLRRKTKINPSGKVACSRSCGVRLRNLE